MPKAIENINDLIKLLTSLRGQQMNEKLMEQVSSAITELFKNTNRSRSFDLNVLQAIIDQGFGDVLVKVLKEGKAIGSNVANILKDNVVSDPNRILLNAALTTFLGEADTQAGKHQFNQDRTDILILPQLSKYIQQSGLVEALVQNEKFNGKINSKRSGEDLELLAEIQRILRDLNSIYEMDINYIRTLLGMLSPALRAMLPINRVLTEIAEYQQDRIGETRIMLDTQNLLQEVQMLDQHVGLFNLFAVGIHNEQAAGQALGHIMALGLDLSSKLIDSSVEHALAFQNAVSLAHNHTKDHEGNTLLHKACQEGHSHVVKEILDLHHDGRLKLDFGDKNAHGRNFADCAARCQNQEAAKEIGGLIQALQEGRYVKAERPNHVEMLQAQHHHEATKSMNRS